MKKVIAVILSCVLALSLVFVTANAQQTNALSFKNGEFRILVLSDTQDDMHPSKDMLNLLKMSIAEAQPDLIVFTGDLVEDWRADLGTSDFVPDEGVVVKDIKGNINHDKTLKNVKVASDFVLSIFQESGVPFAIVQGNNDHKVGLTNAEWLEIYSQYSNCLTVDLSPDADGRIDYNLTIADGSGNTAFNLWLMDSGTGGVNDEQTEWYKQASAALTEYNGGKAVPAIEFQHIPVDDIGNLFEECSFTDAGARVDGTKCYRLNREIAGGHNEFAYTPGRTTELFTAWKDCGDVIGAFFGHNHYEGFSGVWDGIELGFTYGSEFAKSGPYGYRLITISEDDTTTFETQSYSYEGSIRTCNARFVEDSNEIPSDSGTFAKLINLIRNILHFLKVKIIDN